MASRNARSASLACRWMSEKARSPPRITRPAPAMPSFKARGHRADAGDRHDAERDAGDKNAEAAQAAAQIAPDKAQCETPREANGSLAFDFGAGASISVAPAA